MHEFIYNGQPSRVVFGAGALRHLAREIETLGAHKALVLCTPEQRDSAEKIAQLLGPRAAGVFDRAVLHVPIETAREAREVARKLGADCAVAIGGGSTTGLGKAIALDSGLPLAIRDNEVAAESQGIAVGRMKLVVYTVAAFGAGLAGALYFVGNLRISPDAAFSVNWMAFAIFMVVIGGIGRVEGPIVGAVIFWALNKFFSDWGTWYPLGLGALAIAVTLFFKDGLWGFAQKRWDWTCCRFSGAW
ncbi:MAG TPA: iron-containing alcohol dehydrogenase [Ramlibacter sp.]|nr:iron-containing alcohol dehydrogenase [Ramlibacter sp.]